MSEVSERGGPKRRGRRAVALGDPGEDLVPEQKVDTRLSITL